MVGTVELHHGLTILFPFSQALNHNAGSGYGAPEVAMSGQYTIKSDVYSFGVVMLELLTGRQPFDRYISLSICDIIFFALQNNMIAILI